MTNSLQSWLIPITPARRSGVRMICFPYAGAGAIIYRSWAALLDPGIECFAIQPPGRGSRFREDLLSSVSEYARLASLAIRSLPADRPLILFGHSLGALAAYETAVQLKRADCQLDSLVLSGRQDPDSPCKREPISHLQNDVFIEQMASYNGTPAEVLANPDLLELLLPMIKADFSMSEQYRGRSETKLGCRVFALGSRNDDWLDADSLDQWAKVTSGEFQTQWFEGDHFYLNHHTEELVAFLCQKFAGQFASASSSESVVR